MDINAIIAVLSLLMALAGFTEWRIRTVQNALLDKITDRDQISQIQINELNKNIAKLEVKIDMLINLQIQGKNNAFQQSDK